RRQLRTAYRIERCLYERPVLREPGHIGGMAEEHPLRLHSHQPQSKRSMMGVSMVNQTRGSHSGPVSMLPGMESVAVLSDIHGGLPALEAVLAEPAVLAA